jgi:hypothetical protein
MYLETQATSSPQKIGYSSVRVQPTRYRGKPALEILSRGVTRLTLLGSTVEQDATTRTIADLQYRPMEQQYDIKSNGSALVLTASYDYTARKIACRLGTGAEQTRKTLAIPPGANLAADTNFLTGGKKLKAGDKLHFYYLEPLSVELKSAVLEVTGRETLRDPVGGQSVSALRIQTELAPIGKMTTWETDDGDTLRSEISLGVARLVMIKQAKEAALNPNAAAPSTTVTEMPEGDRPYTPPADFAVATAIAPDRPIEDPRRLRRLVVTLTGVPDRRLLLSDDRQKVEILSGDETTGYTARVTVQAMPFAEEAAAKYPVTEAALEPYLKKAAYLDTDNPELRQTAATLRGGETNLYRIATRIHDWVHREMTPDPSIGVPRSATDIFKRRRGVCRDYATLYAALARAAGVPTRLCGGIVYADGKFYYHAWAESYVGKWVAFDPTLYDPKNSGNTVDATHIKFAQGDVSQMYEVVAVIGKLKITVQESE